jgi:hypothetical protein
MPASRKRYTTLKEVGFFVASLAIGAAIQIVVGSAEDRVSVPDFIQSVFSLSGFGTTFKKYIWEHGFFSYLVISLMAWFIFVVLTRVKSYSKCPYFSSQPDGTELSLSLEGMLRDIGGLYEDLQDTHAPLGESSLRAKIRLIRGCPEFQQSIPELVFIRNNCPVSEYARVACLLDAEAKHSILSVNTSLPSALLNSADRDSVAQHLHTVNERKGLRSDRKRIQVLRRGSTPDGSCPGAIATEAAFDADLNDPTLKALWEEHFEAKGSTVGYAKSFWNSAITPTSFYGDFILYDDELVILYDYDTRKLMVVIGSRVGRAFGQVFANHN